MIKRYSHIPIGITRRRFGAMAGAALLGTVSQKIARAADPIFTLVIVPDTQYLNQNSNCSVASGTTLYHGLGQWIVDNKNTVVDGAALNIKGVVQVGDCADTCSKSVRDAGETTMADAYDLIHAAGMFVLYCPGNHDYESGALTGTRNNIGHAWTDAGVTPNNTDSLNGRWGPTNLPGKYSGAGADLGNGDSVVWGGIYSDPTFAQSTANNFIRAHIGSRKLLLVAVEFYPRLSVLNWVADLHAMYPDHELIYTTHGYMSAAADPITGQGTLVTHGSTNNLRTDSFGPAPYGSGACPSYPGSTSGQEQWTTLKTLQNCSLITCGHWANGYNTANDVAGLGTTDNWVWQKRDTLNDAATRTVRQIFCNCQEGDKVPSVGACNTADVAHLMLLRIRPTTCEAYLVSTAPSNTTPWTGGQGVLNQASPVQLFSVPFLPVVTGKRNLPSPLGE